MRGHPLDLIGIYIWCIHLHRGRQIDNHRFFLTGSPFIQDSLTDFQRIGKFCSGKTLRRILKNYFAVIILHIFFYHLGSVDGNLLDLILGHMKYHIPLKGGGGIVYMHYRSLNAFQGFKGFLDQVLPALGQYLNCHIIRNQPAVYQLTQKIIFDLGSTGKTNLYFFKS